MALLCLQLAGLVAYSVHIWHRYDLTSDFATFSQAWQQIGTGNLDPYLSTFAYNYPHYGYPFWQSHFELLMWPLALLWLVSPTSLDLLVVQDLALVASGLVVMRWALEILEAHWRPGRSGTVIGAGVLVALLVNPWTYWTASYDWHFQPIAALFTLLAARDLWQGRRRAWVWVVVVLLCGDVAATYVVAIGISGLAMGRRVRLTSVAMIAAALVWVVLISAIGSGKGSTLAVSYGYLAGHPVPSTLSGIVAIAGGALRHPSRGYHVLRPRWPQVNKYIASTGTLGVASVVGLPLTVIVLLANGLNSAPVFVGAAATFQSVVVVLATLVGAVMLLTWLGRRGRWGGRLALVLGAAMLVQALVVSAQWTHRAPQEFLGVTAATAAELHQVEDRIPTSAEVVVSQGVIGRFGGHRWVYPYLDAFADGQQVPVEAHEVVFVLTTAGLSPGTAATIAAEDYVTGVLHAHLLSRGAGVEAYTWTAPPGVRSVHIPLPA